MALQTEAHERKEVRQEKDFVCVPKSPKNKGGNEESRKERSCGPY